MDQRYQTVLAKRQYCIQISRMLGRAIADVDPGPVQSPTLALSTSAMTPQDVELKSDPDVYFQIGFNQMTFFLQQLESLGFDLRKVSSVLEFGCGSARLLRLLRCLGDVELTGCDISPECVDWCRSQIPDLNFYQNNTEPPLEFLANDSVDLVIAQSVFTHIPLILQTAWLREMSRVLAPGGVFICTVAGPALAERQLDPMSKAQLVRDGQVTLTEDHPRVSWSSRHTRQHDVFQTPERIKEMFGRVFEIAGHVSSWQDVLVLRK